MIKDLEKRKEKAVKRSKTDDLWIKIESLQWVLFVIFAIKKGNGYNLRRLIKMHALEIPETLSPKNGPYIYLLIHAACLLLSR